VLNLERRLVVPVATAATLLSRLGLQLRDLAAVSFLRQERRPVVKVATSRLLLVRGTPHLVDRFNSVVARVQLALADSCMLRVVQALLVVVMQSLTAVLVHQALVDQCRSQAAPAVQPAAETL
jgi:hypothetical protein|tara:strand:+ start:736 stop:1104 length:369 start_codon:yes stop_codon:yes gene_type:complete